jgi:putative transcriptional regulator
MSKVGEKLIAALMEAKEEGLVSLEATPDVAKLRKKLNLSQSEFSRTYRIGLESIKKWEQHKREPESASRAYLLCIQNDPVTMAHLVRSNTVPNDEVRQV